MQMSQVQSCMQIRSGLWMAQFASSAVRINAASKLIEPLSDHSVASKSISISGPIRQVIGAVQCATRRIVCHAIGDNLIPLQMTLVMTPNSLLDRLMSIHVSKHAAWVKSREALGRSEQIGAVSGSLNGITTTKQFVIGAMACIPRSITNNDTK